MGDAEISLKLNIKQFINFSSIHVESKEIKSKGKMATSLQQFLRLIASYKGKYL